MTNEEYYGLYMKYKTKYFNLRKSGGSTSRSSSGGLGNEYPVQDIKVELNNQNLKIVDAGGGGDCFFRSVSHQLYGNPDNHPNLRRQLYNYLKQGNQEDVDDFVWTDQRKIKEISK